MNLNIGIQFATGLSFSRVKDNPLILLEKMPRIGSIVQLANDVFRFTTDELFVGPTSFVGAGAVEIIDNDDIIQLVKSNQHSKSDDNFIIEIEAYSKHDEAFIEGVLGVKHKLINFLTKKLIEPNIAAIKEEITNEFKRNLLNARFTNKIQLVK